jgi:hypothetical protein
MKYKSILVLSALIISSMGLAADVESPSNLDLAFEKHPDLSAVAIASASKKTIEFRNGDHDDSSKILVTILDGKRAQISCVSRFVMGSDSPDIKKVQNGYPFSKEDLDSRSSKWFYGTTRIVGENSELIRKISSYMGPDSPTTGEHQELILSLSPVFERCLKLDQALQGANTHFERVAFSHGVAVPDYKVSSSTSELDQDLLSNSNKKARRN